MRKGFTLIEFLVTISIIGILTATVVISLATFLPSIRLNGSANTLIGNLRQAQEEAITLQIGHFVRFNAQSNPTSYQIIMFSGGVETVTKTIEFPKTLKVVLDPTIADAEIYFSPDGGPSSSGNIVLSDGAISKTVNISPAGVMKVQ